MIILWLVHHILSKLEVRVEDLERRMDALENEDTVGWDPSWAVGFEEETDE